MKPVKLGVFGLWRGEAYARIIADMEGAELVAVCDMNRDRMAQISAFCPAVRCCRAFDELLDSGIDGVLL